MSDGQSKDTEELLHKLDVIGHGGWFVWKIFLLCMVPSILNGLHLTSYVYLAEVPDFWCQIPELSNWTESEIRLVSSPEGLNQSSCGKYDWNYNFLSSLGFEEALNYVHSHAKPDVVPCGAFSYPEGASSMVVNYDLVCDRTALKSTVQVALSLGKFLGAFFFGLVSDRYGRRVSFLCGSVLYVVSGPLVAFAVNYGMVIAGRIGLGAAGSGIYHSAFVILSEIVNKKRRASLGIVFNMSYPIGQMIIPFIAYYIRDWRQLQLTISVPAIFIFLFWWFLPESPRWQISRGKKMKAAKMIEREYTRKVRGRKHNEGPEEGTSEGKEKVLAFEEPHPAGNGEIQASSAPQVQSYRHRLKASCTKIKATFQQLWKLMSVSEMRNRLCIMLFCWCICSLSYYALALNVDNFHTDRYLYGFLTGLVEVPSYILPLPFLRCLGRRHTAIILFYVGGFALISILLIPKTEENNLLILIVASIGRLCASGVFAVVILQTTELFPTVLRNTAIGCGSTSAHVGSMSAPFVVDLLGAYAWFIPSTVCGVATLVAGSLIFLLPETRNKQLPDTVDEILSAPKEDRVGCSQICRR